MPDITEQQIEQYIRFPEELTEDERNRIREAIDESATLRELADFFESYYRELAKTQEQEYPEGNHVVELTPLEFKPPASTSPHLRLAAMSSQAEEGAIMTLATLVSEPDQTLVRVLDNPSSDQYRIHVVSNRLGRDDISILSLDELDTDLVIDEEGHLDFTPDLKIRELDWDHASTRFRFPVGHIKIELEDDLSGSSPYRSGPYEVALDRRKNVLQGTLSKSMNQLPSLSRLVAKGEHTGLQLIPVSGEEFSCEVDPHDQELNFWLYH